MRKVALFVPGFLFAGVVNAQTAFDTTSVQAVITDGITAIAALGAAVLGAIVVLRVWQRLRGAV